jgi:hypothetical protein
LIVAGFATVKEPSACKEPSARPSAELPDEVSRAVDVRLGAELAFEDARDLALLVDDVRDSAGLAKEVAEQARGLVFLRELLVAVGDEIDLETVFFREFTVTFVGVDRDADDLGVLPRQLVEERVEPARLLGADRREVAWIEEEYEVLLHRQLGETKALSRAGDDVEVRCFLANAKRHRGPRISTWGIVDSPGS